MKYFSQDFWNIFKHQISWRFVQRTDGQIWRSYILITNLMHWLLFIVLLIKYYSPIHVSSLKCSSSGGYSCIHAAYDTVTLYESSWWPVGTQLEWALTQGVYLQATRNSHREWQYHMLRVYNCILLKMSTWGSKHVEENSILWINNNQCIKLVINI